ncbi:EamA domain-containing membrane protein RarD [Malaciobacter marinus]|jgi:drug/metabolite transporter (DMT)-like permease|uniref:EamA domain-containing membrane protein RarD n=1 Tax=Malaciobacter marinus TaxID=505249 RepID=A0AB36ZX63_9BACT|nr:DMT family transporter [Malaciobacter marinus]PPK60573.1 EamA domain-containing membrane protein RarD [Malaciobacter marinus]
MKTDILQQSKSVNKGMLFMLLAVLLLPFTDAIAKYLSTSLSPTQIAWIRFFMQVVFIFLISLFIKQKIQKFRFSYIFLGLFVSLTIILLFWGLRYLPLANNIALFFIEPMVLTILSVIFLKEKIFYNHIIAVLIGLVGTFIIIRPNFALYGIASFLPIASAICYALYLMSIRMASNLGNSISLQFWVGIVATFFLSIVILFGESFNIEVFSFHKIDSSIWWILLILGIGTTIVQLLVSSAFFHAKASTLASFQYLEIISATILGWLMFNEIPDKFTILGALIVIFAGIYLVRHERRVNKG